MIYQGSYQIITRAMKIVIALVLAYCLGLVFVFTGVGITTSSDIAAAGLLIGSQLLTLFIVVGVIVFVRKSSDIKVYSDRLEYSSTFLVKKVKRIEASKIESVDFSESLLGRSNYGAVKVKGSGTGIININPVKLPERLAEEVRKIASSPSSKSNNNTNSMASKLTELNELLKQGVITQEDFEKAKNKILE